MDELIGKYLANEATTEESRALQAWIEKDESNRQYFAELKLVFDKASAIKDLPAFDTDVAWARLKAKINSNQSTSASIPQRTLSPWTLGLRIAASLAFIALVGYVAYQSFVPEEQIVQLTATTETVHDSLPDGSTAFLNKNTSLTFTYDQKKKSRTARLEGEGFFEVVHNEDVPFLIEAAEVIIEDLGTAFNVKAYPGSSTVEVFVESGVVAFYTKENPGLTLSAGQTGVYDKAKDVFSWTEKADSNILAYKTKVFGFNDSDLASVVERLNAVYDVKLKLAKPELGQCRLNVTFQGETIEVIADIISETLSLTYTKEGNEIILDGEGCVE